MVHRKWDVMMEGVRARNGAGNSVVSVEREILPTRTEHSENFPVASYLVAPQHRVPILAFYRFVRAADDIADHPTLTPDEKLRGLAAMKTALKGDGGDEPKARALREALTSRGLTARHALEVLVKSGHARHIESKPHQVIWRQAGPTKGPDDST